MNVVVKPSSSNMDSGNLLRKDAPTKTEIELNPFALFGISSRDDKRRIAEIIEEKSLSIDPSVCSRARSDLTNPRTRLKIELSWLPNTSPKRAKELIADLRNDPAKLLNNPEIEPLAFANLLAAEIELLSDHLDVIQWTEWLRLLTNACGEIENSSVLRHINEDRTIAGIPEIHSIEQIDAELELRKRAFKDAAHNVLNRLPSDKLIAILTQLTDLETEGGKKHANDLLDMIIDGYQLEAEEALLANAQEIAKSIDLVSGNAANGEPQITQNIESIMTAIDKWLVVARPIQVSLKSRGLEHETSAQLGRKFRNMAVDLTNNFNQLEASKKITDYLSKSFIYLPEFSASVGEDVEALDKLFSKRDKDKEETEEWKQSVTREIEFGFIFKKKFKCSPDGIEYGGYHFPLHTITRVRWGGVRHSVNGIPTGTSYKVAFGDDKTEAVISLSSNALYTMMTDCIWKAVCIRLMTNLLQSLREGQKLRFGNAIIDDEGVELVRHKMFSSEKFYCKWGRVRVWSSGGNYFIRCEDDKKACSQASFMNDPNVHILEACLRASFKNFDGKLSSLLK